ncbi:MAG: ABC transporter permease [Thermoleophilia bacterium]|nr:ABC transporter permease [Thermoleophilia bacterium]
MSTVIDPPALEGAAPGSRRRRRSPWFWRLGVLGEVIAFVGLWELATSGFRLVGEAFLPAPSAVFASLVDLVGDDEFVSALTLSLKNMTIGLLLAAVVGIAVGLAVGWFRVLQVTVAPLLWTLYSAPKEALAPLMILALGLGSTSKIALVFLLSLFPIVLNTMEGAQTVGGSLVRAARVYDCNGVALGRKVVFPAAFPFVLVGLQRGVGLAFTGEILGEFLGGAGGLGHMLERATFDFQMDDALAIVVVMALTANVLLLITGWLQKRFAPWHSGEVVAVG